MYSKTDNFKSIRDINVWERLIWITCKFIRNDYARWKSNYLCIICISYVCYKRSHMVVLLSFNSKWYFKCFVSPSAGNIYDNDKCSDTYLPRIFIWKENTKYEELINESYIVKCKISTHTMIKMNVLRMMALYMDHVICLLSLKEAGAFLTVKHRYTPNKSMSTSTEKENKMFNKKRSLIHRKK